MPSCRIARTRHADASLMYRLQEMFNRTLTDLAAVFDSLLDRFPKMKPDQDTRDPIFVGGLRESGVRPQHLLRSAAPLLGERQGQATSAKGDMVGLEHTLQHFCRRASFDTVGRVVIRDRRGWF